MAAIHLHWPRSGAGLVHAMPKSMLVACAAAAVAEVSYLIARVVGDVHRIEADRREWDDWD